MEKTTVDKLRQQIELFLENYDEGADFDAFSSYCESLMRDCNYGYSANWTDLDNAEEIKNDINKIWQLAKSIVTTQDFLSHVNEGTYGEEYDDFIFVMNVLSICAETMKYMEDHEDERLKKLSSNNTFKWSKQVYPKLRSEVYIIKKIPVPAELSVEISFVLYKEDEKGRAVKINKYYVTRQTENDKEIKEYTFDELETDLRAAILKNKKL